MNLKDGHFVLETPHLGLENRVNSGELVLVGCKAHRKELERIFEEVVIVGALEDRLGDVADQVFEERT